MYKESYQENLLILKPGCFLDLAQDPNKLDFDVWISKVFPLFLFSKIVCNYRAQ